MEQMGATKHTAHTKRSSSSVSQHRHDNIAHGVRFSMDLTGGNSLLFRSVRIVLNFDQATSENAGVAAKDNACKDCVSSAQDIAHIVRKYRSQFGLGHSPLIMIYAIMQASRTLAAFGTPEEAQYLLLSLDECSSAWTLAHQVRDRLTHVEGWGQP